MQIELRDLELRYDALRVRDAARTARMRASLASDGQQSPVLVLESTTGLVLVDGYLRVTALDALGRDLVEAVVLDLGEPDALILGHRLDEIGRRSALEEGWLLEELVTRHSLRQSDLATRLGRSRSWVNRRLALVSVLPEVAQQSVRVGTVPAQAAMKYLVPLSRDNHGACERIVTQLGSEAVTVRQTKRLYMSWRRADADVRSRIEAHPRLFLKADAVDEVEMSPTRRIVRDLDSVSAACARANRTLADGNVDHGNKRLRLAFREATRSFATLSERMTEHQDAGPLHPDRDPSPASGGKRGSHDRACSESIAQRGA